MLIAAATGGGSDARFYGEMRRDILADPAMAQRAPRFIRTCRDAGAFWEFIKGKFAHYSERRTFIRAELDPLLTLRARADLGSLRGPRRFPVLERAIAAASRSDFRIVHFSVQGDHLHLIAEAHDKAALSSGMRGLMIRAARALNCVVGRSGPVWADRYHCRELGTPREVRNALVYVLLNSRKHGRDVAALDPCSSARWFDGWRNHDPVVDLAVDPPTVVAPRTWLLGVGWRRHGLVRLDVGPRDGAHFETPRERR